MKEIRLPQLGQSVEEARITGWLKGEGDPVKKGEPLFTVETDKAEIEVESPEAGILRKIIVSEDAEVPVLTVVALVGTADEKMPDLTAYASDKAAKTEPQQTTTAAQAPQPIATTGLGAPRLVGQRAPVSPRAKALARSAGLNATNVQGTGPGGRVIAEDVSAFLDGMEGIAMTPTARRAAKREGIDVRTVKGTGPRGRIVKEDVALALVQQEVETDVQERVPLTTIRRTIARRMSESKFSAPHYYVSVEVDMSAAVTYRKSSRKVKPSFNDLIVFAVSRVLQEFPRVNARWNDDGIDILKSVHLGIAVAIEDGLIVPVLRNVATLSMDDIHDASTRLVTQAREGALMPDDYAGSTFTISNLGPYGVDQFTAIINAPNSAILAVGRISDQPAVVDGKLAVRPIMNLTLSSDHRVIDGALAAQFMGRLREFLETLDS